MQILLQSKVLSTFDGVLEVVYDSTDDHTEIKEFVYTIEDRVNRFALEFIQINEQPLTYFKDLKSLIVTPNTLIDSFDIKETNLHLFLNLQDQITLTFLYEDQLCDTAKTLELKVNKNFKLEQLKEYLLRTFDLDPNFKLTHSYRLNESLSLFDLGIKDGASLKIVDEFEDRTAQVEIIPETHLQGVSVKPITFTKFQDEILIDLLPYEQADKWRSIVPGLNLEGECISENCPAHTQRVYVPLGIGKKISIGKECKMALCPMCEGQLKNVDNCVFWDCKYSIVGKFENNKRFEKKLTQAPKERAVSFKGQDQEDIVKWKFLNIDTFPSDEPKVEEASSLINEEESSPKKNPTTRCTII